MIIRTRPFCAVLLACALAKPAAAQVPSAPTNLLATEGIDAAPPQGFPPFVQIGAHNGTAVRSYRSRRDTRTIAIIVMGPLSSWSDSTLDARRRMLDMVGTDHSGPDTTWVDSMHLVRQFRGLQPDGNRGIERSYVSRSGALTLTSIIAIDENDTPDPASDPAILAFLDAAQPRADTGGPDLLAQEGVNVAPPAGFPIFSLSADTARAGTRIYRSQSGTQLIVVGVTDPFISWATDGNDARRGVLQAMGERFARSFTDPAETSIREDSTHLWWEARGRGPGGERLIFRLYTPRTGAPAIVGIRIEDNAADPATDPEVLGFLDAARPWPDTGIPASRVFRDKGLSMVLAPGLVPPTTGSSIAPGMQTLVSHSGNRSLWCMIIDNEERGASRWPTERRVQRLHGLMSELLNGFAPQVESQIYARGELAYSDVRFDRAPGLGLLTGRGRIYTTQSGPHRMIAIMYFETDTNQIADEAAVMAMLDSVQLLGNR